MSCDPCLISKCGSYIATIAIRHHPDAFGQLTFVTKFSVEPVSVSVNSVTDLSRFLPFTNVSYGSIAEHQSKIAEHITFLRAIKNPVDH